MGNGGDGKTLLALLANPWLRHFVTWGVMAVSLFLGYLATVASLKESNLATLREVCSVRRTQAVLLNLHAEESPEILRIYGPKLIEESTLCSSLH